MSAASVKHRFRIAVMYFNLLSLIYCKGVSVTYHETKQLELQVNAV